METNKEKMHPFFKILFLLFLIFISLFIALESGYYPSRIQKKTILTNNEINNFEKDLKSGKEISSEGYIKEEVDYSNFVTKAGNGLTYSVGKILSEGSKGLKYTFKYLFG